MPFATDADLLLVYPALSSVSAPLRALFLEQSQAEFNECAWGSSLLLGHIYLTAHMIAMATGGASSGAGGQVSGKSMGPVSISYAVATGDAEDGAFGETAAGRQYLALRNSLGPMAAVPGGGCDNMGVTCP